MTEPTRLFDCLEMHLQDAPSITMMAAKENGSWKEYTTHEVADIVDKLQCRLIADGY